MAQEGAAELIFRGRREQKAAFPPCVRAIFLVRQRMARNFPKQRFIPRGTSDMSICKPLRTGRTAEPWDRTAPLCAKRARGERAAHKIAFSFFLAGGGNVGGITTEIHRTKTQRKRRGLADHPNHPITQISKTNHANHTRSVKRGDLLVIYVI